MGSLAPLAQEVLACHGALIDPAPDHTTSSPHAPEALEAVLPPALGRRLQLPEHVHIVEGQPRPPATRLAYGTELLERLIDLATEATPLAAATLAEPLPKSSDVLQTALQHFTPINGVLRPSDQDPDEHWGGYLMVDYRYIADADERREGLLRVVIDAEVGADIGLLHGLDAHPLLDWKGSRAAPVIDADETLRRADRAARRRLRPELEPLTDSIRRRHLRDRARLRGYFGGLRDEMAKRLRRLQSRGTAAEEVATRLAKIDALQPQLERKLSELEARYRLKVELVPIAALQLAIRARQVIVTAHRRRASRPLTLRQNAATRTFDPLRCDGCGDSVYAFALCDGALHVLCGRCDEGRPTARHCPVCPQRGRR